jgi:hypothetical protein
MNAIDLIGLQEGFRERKIRADPAARQIQPPNLRGFEIVYHVHSGSIASGIRPDVMERHCRTVPDRIACAFLTHRNTGLPAPVLTSINRTFRPPPEHRIRLWSNRDATA